MKRRNVDFDPNLDLEGAAQYEAIRDANKVAILQATLQGQRSDRGDNTHIKRVKVVKLPMIQKVKKPTMVSKIGTIAAIIGAAIAVTIFFNICFTIADKLR